jgi:hypothetical protein
MEPSKADSVVLHASSRWWNKIDLRRDRTPWITFPRWGKGFSLDGKDYTVTRRGRVGAFELSQAGQSIMAVQSRGGLLSEAFEFDFAGKQWAMKKAGVLSVGANLECAGQIVGEFRTPQGFNFGRRHDARLPRELPDVIQVFLIWMYINTIGVNTST